MEHLSKNEQAGDAALTRGGSLRFLFATVVLVAFSAVAATGLACWLRLPPSPPGEGKGAVKWPGRLFHGWTKPDVVFVLTGQQLGYLQPCGCSSPQIGGLERRYNLVARMKEAGWQVVPLDLGNVPQKAAPAGLPNLQALIKYKYAMTAMEKIGYRAVAYGEVEAGLGMFTIYGEYWLNNPDPRGVMSNHIDAHKNFDVKPWWYADIKEADLRVGFAAIVGPTVAAHIKGLVRNDKAMRFGPTVEALDHVTQQMARGGVGLPVLLYQGPVTRDHSAKKLTEASAVAAAYPQFPLVVALSEEDEPSYRPTMIDNKDGGKSMVVAPGRKGKYVAVVGVWKTGDPKKPFELKYERVEMTEDFLTPKAEEKSHPIAALMEAYTSELKAQKYLEKYGQVKHALQVMPEVKGLRNPGTAEYMGSEACKKCHEHAYEIWAKTPHSHAYKTLVDARHPSNREYDPECIVCHTVGFGHETGFRNAESQPRSALAAGKKLKHGLKDVGCEACHGPSSLHARNPNNAEWRKRINPWRYQHTDLKKRANAIDMFCQKCHDIDNDVSWLGGGFAKKWPKVEHNTPKDD